MSGHLIDGEFQSDKYPTTPRGLVPLKTADVNAQDLLWEYAQRRRPIDAEFSDDLESALKLNGFAPDTPDSDLQERIKGALGVLRNEYLPEDEALHWAIRILESKVKK